MWKRLSLLAAVVYALPAPPASGASCRIPHAEVVLRAKEVMVLERTIRDEPVRHLVWACSRINGRTNLIGEWDESRTLEPPLQRFRAAGRFLAFSRRQESDGDGFITLTVQRW